MVDNGDILKKSAVKSALSDYQHYNPNVNKNLTFDTVLDRLANNPSFRDKKLPITFIMLRISNQDQPNTE